MEGFQRPDISYKPLEVENLDPTAIAQNVQSEASGSDEAEAIANRLMDHLAQIQAYRDRIDAIDYLINNARSLSGNLQYITTDTGLLTAIQSLGENIDYVDLKLFEKAVDIVIEGYKEMSLISLTGVAKK